MQYVVIMILLLVLTSGPVHAEWVLISKAQAEPATYIDSDTIRRKGNMVRWWQLLDYKTVQTMADISYLSVKIQMEFDCAEEQIRALALSQFSGNMGSGEVVFSNFTKDEWEPVQPGSRGHTLWKVACRKQ